MKEAIQTFFKGEVADDEATLKKYSIDASLFEVRPKLVVYPKDSEDIRNLVKWVEENKKNDPTLSITIRAAGSCMSGGSLNDSIIVDVMKHMNTIGEIKESGTVVSPGVFYRDFEPKTLEKNLLLPCYTASKSLNALGGMFGNNSAGEKTLRYGKMENFILESKVIFADGKEYVVKPLSRNELEVKMAQKDFEGKIYKDIANLVSANKRVVEEARPKVSKNSAGYYLWNLWQPAQTGEEVFDLNRLLVGSQGTLGLVTEMKLRLVPVEKMSKLFVIFLPDLTKLAELVNEILPTNPDSVETYDDSTLKLAFKFFPEMLKSLRPKHFMKLIFSFIPEAFMMMREKGLPKLVVLVEYAGNDMAEIENKIQNLKKRISHFNFIERETRSQEESDKYWTIRRESFNLLRKHVQGSRTAPFIDDVIVDPKYMPEFLPRMREILDRHNLVYTIAGHAGNGNFHIIPLMKMQDKDTKTLINTIENEVYKLVAEYKGSITAEHNDGIVRTPYLNFMYSNDAIDLFKRTKEIFDPAYMFNPGKKVPTIDGKGTREYLNSHIVSQ
ncbi:MAG: Oxidoreductase [Parcubacteria group bacterium]|nr:Oxidoreductase [Parcubacteria group bacterium]